MRLYQDAKLWRWWSFFHQLSGDHLPGSCLIVEAEDLRCADVAKRLAMTHRIIEYWPYQMQIGCTLRVCRSSGSSPKKYWSGLDALRTPSPGADAVEHEVGRVLFQKGYRADLKDPEMVLRAIITTGKIVLGREAALQIAAL